MIVLAVDTCFAACSVAIVSGDKVLAHVLEPIERGHAEALAPMVESAIKTAALEFSDIDRLGVATGPGTFTGQRVGLAFMRGLRIALKKPLVGLSSLATMAHQAMVEAKCGTVVVVQEARRDEVYFEIVSEKAVLNTGPLLLASAVAATHIEDLTRNEKIVIAGSAAARFVKHENAALSPVFFPDARWVAALTLTAEATDAAPKPLYLRAPDARLQSQPK
jgi:tRNA threonylcarbamoyladenosine biosynthesis protein TsaB